MSVTDWVDVAERRPVATVRVTDSVTDGDTDAVDKPVAIVCVTDGDTLDVVRPVATVRVTDCVKDAVDDTDSVAPKLRVTDWHADEDTVADERPVAIVCVGVTVA